MRDSPIKFNNNMWWNRMSGQNPARDFTNWSHVMRNSSTHQTISNILFSPLRSSNRVSNTFYPSSRLNRFVKHARGNHNTNCSVRNWRSNHFFSLRNYVSSLAIQHIDTKSLFSVRTNRKIYWSSQWLSSESRCDEQSKLNWFPANRRRIWSRWKWDNFYTTKSRKTNKWRDMSTNCGHGIRSPLDDFKDDAILIIWEQFELLYLVEYVSRTFA